MQEIQFAFRVIKPKEFTLQQLISNLEEAQWQLEKEGKANSYIVATQYEDLTDRFGKKFCILFKKK